MNRKITVELDWDTIDKITTCSMKGLVENLEIDLENRKAGNGMAIFDHDIEKDIAEIEKHIDAFKTVLKYYGEGNE
jgi:hypothetical protein